MLIRADAGWALPALSVAPAVIVYVPSGREVGVAFEKEGKSKGGSNT